MTIQTDKALAYAIRGNAFGRYLGHLCLAVVGIALIPGLVALAARDFGFSAWCMASALLLAVLGALLSRIHGPQQLLTNESLVVIALGYLLTACVMSLPLAADGVAPLDALFHSMSAVTTTGLTTLESVEHRSVSFLFTQAWMQWYGGLIIIVLAVFLVGPGPAARQLAASDSNDRDLMSGTRTRAIHTLTLYGAITVAGVLLLVILGQDWMDALLHALTAISTGGFSSHDDSLSGLNGIAVEAGVMLLAFAGAISSSTYLMLLRRTPQRSGPNASQPQLRLHLVTLCAACLIVTALLCATLMLVQGLSWQQVLRDAPLLAVSAQTTTGFTPLPVAALDDGSKLVLTLAMLIGGDLGSTAGGIKIFRLLVILRLVQLLTSRTALPPHAVSRGRIAGRALEERDVEDALGVVALYALVVLASWLAFVLFGYPAMDSLFEVVSATATVGLSAGLSGPHLEPLLKGVLIMDMWMGRLEILAVLLLFAPGTWFGRRAETP
jgi:trk/ktr system potassium uptake protein